MAQAKLVTLIETSDTYGRGTVDDPVRRVRQWWALKGELIVESDEQLRATIKIQTETIRKLQQQLADA